MNRTECEQQIDDLIDRSGGEGAHVVGVLIVDDDGIIMVAMDGDTETDILMIGVNAQRRGSVVADSELGNITPVTNP